MGTIFTLGLATAFAETQGRFRDTPLRRLGRELYKVYGNVDVREAFRTDGPMDAPHDGTQSEIVIADVGWGLKVLNPEVAALLLEVHRRVPGMATIDAPPKALGLTTRAIVVSDIPVHVEFAADDDVFGACRTASARKVRSAVQRAGKGEVAEAIAMLNLCAVHFFALAVRETT